MIYLWIFGLTWWGCDSMLLYPFSAFSPALKTSAEHPTPQNILSQAQIAPDMCCDNLTWGYIHAMFEALRLLLSLLLSRGLS